MMKSKRFLEYVEDVLLNRREDATERLLDFAETLSTIKKTKKLRSKHGEMTLTRAYHPFFGERN